MQFAQVASIQNRDQHPDHVASILNGFPQMYTTIIMHTIPG